MSKAEAWERIRTLGEGGQSQVFLVRKPERVEERASSIRTIIKENPWTNNLQAEPGDRLGERTRGKIIDKFANALWQYVQPENTKALGAMKCFKLRDKKNSEQHLLRLKKEIAVLSQGRPGLPKLLNANEAEAWIVTEFFPEGTLEDHHATYTAQPLKALRAFRSLVTTVADLHAEKITHRDIKPANVFVRNVEELVLGDFGIVHLPDAAERVTVTDERVGPRDYMPQWADLGERLERVEPSFDVYMLGKLLWCMLAGRLRLPREYHRRPNYDLTVLFSGDPKMHSINTILDRCIVEDPGQCLPSAQELLPFVDEQLEIATRGGQLLEPGVPRPCRVCGKGLYSPAMIRHEDQRAAVFALKLDWPGDQFAGVLKVCPFACNVCGHVELFK